MRIVKTFFGKHIDLDHIVAISDAYITSSVPWCLNTHPAVEFTIEFALRDEPMKHTRLLTHEEYKDGKFVMLDGTLDDSYYYRDEKSQTLAEANLQAQIDELIFEWKHKA